MDAEKPRVYVSAFLCTTTLLDKDTELLSAIQITYAFTSYPRIRIPRLPDGSPDTDKAEMVSDPARCKMLIAMHAEAERTFDFRMKLRGPSGEHLNEFMADPSGLQTVGAGAHGGLTLNIGLTISTSDSGLYWFEIYIDGEVATKLPLFVFHAPLSSDAPPARPTVGE
jgi:hypothetical protein